MTFGDTEPASRSLRSAVTIGPYTLDASLSETWDTGGRSRRSLAIQVARYLDGEGVEVTVSTLARFLAMDALRSLAGFADGRCRSFSPFRPRGTALRSCCPNAWFTAHSNTRRKVAS